jgi:hypothetical protein
MQTVLSTSDTGQGSGAVAWLTGDFTGSGQTQIAQLWNNRDRLGLVIYGFADGAVHTVLTTSDLRQPPRVGPEALAWLTGDFTEPVFTQIAQLVVNDGLLGLVIYGHFDGVMQTMFGTSNINQEEPWAGYEALAWLTGNFSGPGTTQIAHLLVNYGLLAMVIYGTPGAGVMAIVGNDTGTGQGPAALAWLTGDFTGSGKTQIAQPWDNNGQLGLIIYGEAKP